MPIQPEASAGRAGRFSGGPERQPLARSPPNWFARRHRPDSAGSSHGSANIRPETAARSKSRRFSLQPLQWYPAEADARRGGPGAHDDGVAAPGDDRLRRDMRGPVDDAGHGQERQLAGRKQREKRGEEGHGAGAGCVAVNA